MRTRKSIFSIVAAGALLLALPGTAGAPKIFGLPDAMGACTQEGVGTGSYVGGAVTVASFESKDGDLFAQVELTAACRIDDVIGSQTDSSGLVDAAVLESDRSRLLISLLGSLSARPDENGRPTMTFDVDSSVEIAGEGGANSVVKRVAAAPELSAEQLAMVLNRYLNKK